MGVGSTFEQPLSSSSLKAESPMQHEDMPGMHREGMQMAKPEISKAANSVPGFPQDAFMEGPTMAMDQMVDKPGSFGLRPGWVGLMAGMITFVRVLLKANTTKSWSLRKREGNKPINMDMPVMEHKNE